MARHTRGKPPSPEDTAAELRELLRDAHAAINDMTRLLREARQTLPADATRIMDRVMETHVNAELLKLQRFLAGESERISRIMASEVTKARERMMNDLELVAVTETETGLRAEFGRKSERE